MYKWHHIQQLDTGTKMLPASLRPLLLSIHTLVSGRLQGCTCAQTLWKDGIIRAIRKWLNFTAITSQKIEI